LGFRFGKTAQRYRHEVDVRFGSVSMSLADIRWDSCCSASKLKTETVLFLAWKLSS
jgi:hypothetical protein